MCVYIYSLVEGSGLRYMRRRTVQNTYSSPTRYANLRACVYVQTHVQMCVQYIHTKRGRVRGWGVGGRERGVALTPLSLGAQVWFRAGGLGCC